LSPIAAHRDVALRLLEQLDAAMNTSGAVTATIATTTTAMSLIHTTELVGEL